MNKEDVLRMARARFGGYADQAASLFEQFASDIRSATKEEDSMICDALQPEGNEDAYLQGAWEAGTLDCAEAIRASK